MESLWRIYISNLIKTLYYSEISMLVLIFYTSKKCWKNSLLRLTLVIFIFSVTCPIIDLTPWISIKVCLLILFKVNKWLTPFFYKLKFSAMFFDPSRCTEQTIQTFEQTIHILNTWKFQVLILPSFNSDKQHCLNDQTTSST